MSSIARSALEIGPCKVTHNSHTFYAKEGGSLILTPDYVKLATDRHGTLDSRIADMVGRFTVTPDGAWTSAARAGLWPYASTSPGASLGGQGSIVIHCNDSAGNRYTGRTAILTGCPQLLLSARRSMMGPAEYAIIRTDDTAPSVANSFIQRDASSFADSTFTVASLKTQAYTGALSGVLTGIEAEDGWTVNFALSTVPKLSDRYGTLDFRFADLEVSASCVPINQSVADIMTAIRAAGTAGWTAGQSMQAAGAAFTLTGEDSTVALTLANAFAFEGSLRFGATDYRQAGITFMSTRTLSAGALQPLFVLA